MWPKREICPENYEGVSCSSEECPNVEQEEEVAWVEGATVVREVVREVGEGKGETDEEYVADDWGSYPETSSKLTSSLRGRKMRGT